MRSSYNHHQSLISGTYRQILVCLILFYVVTSAGAQRSAWNLGGTSRSRRSDTHSQQHVSLGRISLSPSSFSRSTTSSSSYSYNGEVALDTSSWNGGSINNHVSTALDDSRHHTALASVRTKVRTRRRSKQHTITELEEDLQREGTSAEILHELTRPLVKAKVWEELVGDEFNNPSTTEALTKSGLYMAQVTNPKNEWVTWKPADKTTIQAQQDGTEEKVVAEGGVLVYLGKWKKEGYGSSVPVVKSISIINMSPKQMAELLLDSSRVKTYNKMSQGRKDVRVMQRGVDTHDHFGHGETKIVRNITKPPVAKKKMLSVTLMHGRALRPTDGIQEGGYVVVSRAVGDPAVETEDYTLSEILLGVNVLRNTENHNQCRVTAVTHVYSPNLPTALASRLGIKGAKNFVKDIRSVCDGDSVGSKVVASK